MLTKVFLFLDTRKIAAGNVYPVKIKIHHNRNNSTRSTNVFCAEKDWDFKKTCVRRFVVNASQLNEQLMKMLSLYEQYISEHQGTYTLNSMSAADIFKAVDEERQHAKQPTLTSSDPQDSFMYMLHSYIENSRTKGTKKGYVYTEQKLLQYISVLPKNQREIDWYSIDYRFLTEFDRYMENNNIGVNTRAIVMRNIRTLWNRAIDYDIVSIDKYPFRKFKIKTARKEKEYLPLDGLHKLIALDFSDVQGRATLERARDFFLLSFFMCGMNPIDLFYLPKQQERVSFVRTKIKYHNPNPIKFQIQPEVQNIIDRYSGRELMLEYYDHYIDYDSFYAHIKHRIDRIGVMIGYPHLTLYWARYSWATYAAQLDVPINVIGKALGHADATLAEERYISFDWSKVDDANRKVIDYIMKDVKPNSLPAPKYAKIESKK